MTKDLWKEYLFIVQKKKENIKNAKNLNHLSGFMVMGLVSGWSLANHSNSESFLVVHASLSQDGCQQRDSGKWRDTQCLLSTFPKLFCLVVAY